MIRDTSSQDELIEPTTLWKRRKLLVAVGVASTIAVAAFAYPSIQQWASAEQTISRDRLRIATVTRGDLRRDISATGSVIAAIKPTLFSPADGVVTLEVQAGDTVKRGEAIARIESPETRNLLEQEGAALSQAETSFERQKIESRKNALENQQRVDLAEVDLIAARRELRRAEAARAKDAISEFDYDKAQDDLATAQLKFRHASEDAKLQQESLAFELRTRELEIERQRLRVAELERRVDELDITSPVTGIVGNLLVANKDAVAQNQPLLTVVDLTAFEVELQIPDSYGSALAIGQAAEVSHQGQTWPATLISVSPEVINSQITAKVRFDGTPPDNMKQNQRVSARILLGSKEDVLMVERGPFLESSGGRFTYVVEGDLAKRTRIQSGMVSVGAVEVVSGLEAGDEVVISSLTDFRDADVVYLTD